ncbi:MAG: glycosyltransferase family 39 protein [Blastocatellia bacterium]
MLVSCWRNQQFSYFPYNMRFTYNPEFSENYSQAASLHFYLLVALALLLLLGGLHKGDLSGYDDAAYAYEAKTILATGDWWTLSLNGSQDFDKPPLFVWCLAISMQVFGKSDFAAKLPAALFGFGTILLVYQLAQELTGCKWISIFSMLVLVSTQYFLKYATHAMTGVPFTFFFTLAIWLYLKGYRQSQHWLFCGFAFGATKLDSSSCWLAGDSHHCDTPTIYPAVLSPTLGLVTRRIRVRRSALAKLVCGERLSCAESCLSLNVSSAEAIHVLKSLPVAWEQVSLLLSAAPFMKLLAYGFPSC